MAAPKRRARYPERVNQKQYPEDEFDIAGRSGPVGAHFAPESRWKRIFLPLLIVLIVAPLLGWVALLWISPADIGLVDSKPTTATTTPTTAPPTTTPPPASPSPTTPSPTPSETVDKAVKIQVLNNSGRQGLAAKVADKLKEGGYTNTSADNASGFKASTPTTVFYTKEEDKAAALAIAEAAGLSADQVRQKKVSDQTPIVVLLGKDFNN